MSGGGVIRFMLYGNVGAAVLTTLADALNMPKEAAAASAGPTFEAASLAKPLLSRQEFVESTAAHGRVLILIHNEDYNAEVKSILDQPKEANGGVSANCVHFYHHRYIWYKSAATAEEFVHDITMEFLERKATFVSTRDVNHTTTPTTFLGAIKRGLASDGGLFMPLSLPHLPVGKLQYLCEVEESYIETAQIMVERLADSGELPAGIITDFVQDAYSAKRWENASICPVTPLYFNQEQSNKGDDASAASGVFVIELYHGPTAAFKDFALQLFPKLFTFSCFGDDDTYMILAATSGDTGVAAISGFKNSSDVPVMVLYPDHGVSPVQKVQMQTYDDGQQVRVVGVESDFDYCQTTVKHIFGDMAIAERLHKEHGIVLSSANSINWGRLLPQIVYYFHSYGQLVKHQGLKFGDLVDVAVPTGNFGNILSAFIGKKMGLPIRRFILASNRNDVLYEFVTSGVYDISEKEIQPTASPSIDILKASNVERFLYLISDGNAELVAKLMNDLNTVKRFELPEELKKVVTNDFWAANCTEEECNAAIRDTFAKSNGCRLVDPHTAVGVHVLNKYLEVQQKNQDTLGPRIPVLLASTAHWAKFPEPVMKAIGASTDVVRIEGENDEDFVQAMHSAIVKHAAEARSSAAASATAGADAAPPVRIHGALEAAMVVAQEQKSDKTKKPVKSEKNEEQLRELMFDFVGGRK